jgi:hypothetical protein
MAGFDVNTGYVSPFPAGIKSGALGPDGVNTFLDQVAINSWGIGGSDGQE